MTNEEFEAAGKPDAAEALGEQEQTYDPGTSYRRPDERRDTSSNRQFGLDQSTRLEGLRRWNLDSRCYEVLHEGVWQRESEQGPQNLISLGYVPKSRKKNG
jgi:hypothetical protein